MTVPTLDLPSIATLFNTHDSARCAPRLSARRVCVGCLLQLLVRRRRSTTPTKGRSENRSGSANGADTMTGRSPFGLKPLRSIPGTATIGGIILAGSLIGMITEQAGFGLSSLFLDRQSIFELQLWRLVTYAFVEASAINLLFGLFILWMFAGWFESRYGRRDFIRFFLLSVTGGAIISMPLGWFFGLVLPFRDLPGMGPDAAIDAMLVAFAFANPKSNILFGFVIPMRTRTAIYAILGLEVVFGIMGGASTLGITMGGMLMGYLLVTGNWRPSRLLSKIRRKRRTKVSRKGFYVVPPHDDTLH
ncbi:MAG: hypothetical protein A2289_18575 [Deltaproteobacteria bacterium RIFOXYA12_FULL_58_15]|nr:MAG: hypothetical protein A2289_18575 [Deltaproteobacteria bacterium RIFOXYA12_FULL_58_15]OGR12838.1 MAG: hypothetical protein A2341_21930 [Deltaproteobacteria bacterium RIFOXYB12_FULL_58_9]